MFTSAHLVARLQQSRLKRAGKRGISIWARDYERPYGTAKEAFSIVQQRPFGDLHSYQLCYDAGSVVMHRLGIRAARKIARWEEVYLAKISHVDSRMDAEELKDYGLRLSLYSVVMTAALARVGRFHTAVQLVRRLVDRFSHPSHRDVLGAQAEREGLKYLLVGAPISACVCLFPSEKRSW